MPRFIEVVVGRAEQLKGWVSCEDDLKQIPYFKVLLEELMNGKITNIKLPDEDPGAFSQALYFGRTGTMQTDYAALCNHNNNSNPNGKLFHSKSGEIVKTIVLAKRFGLEGLQNAACDNLRKAMSYIRLTSSDMLYIMDHCDQTDPLYGLTMQYLAVYINHIGWSQWRLENDGWYRSFCDGRPFNADFLASALITYKDCEYPTTADGVCQWHTHNTIAPCAPTVNQPEVDVTDAKRESETDMPDLQIESEANDMEMFEWSNGSTDEDVFDSDESIDLGESLEELTM